MPDKSSISTVHFHFMKVSRHPLQRKKLKAFIATIFRNEKTALRSLAYIFCTDHYLLGINQQFLEHNDYTDIISFDLAANGQPVEGEIYISLDRVADNAHQLGQRYQDELHRVIFHGALHLCGYKDKKPKDIARMRKMENHYLLRYSNIVSLA